MNTIAKLLKMLALIDQHTDSVALQFPFSRRLCISFTNPSDQF